MSSRITSTSWSSDTATYWSGLREEWRPEAERDALIYTEDSPYPKGLIPGTPWDRRYFEQGHRMRLLNRQLRRREITGGVPRDILAQALALVREDGLLLYFAGEELRGHRELVATAVQEDARAFQYAASQWRADRAIALTGVLGSWWMLAHAAPALQADDAIVGAALDENSLALCYADPAYQADFATAHREVSRNGAVLACLPLWQDDPDMVMTAVSSNGEALCSASPRLRADLPTALVAVAQSWSALRCADPLLQANPIVVHAALRQHDAGDGAQALQYAAPALQADFATVQIAVDQHVVGFYYAAPIMQANHVIAHSAIMQDGGALGAADPSLQADRTLALTAIWRNAYALPYVAPSLQANPDFLIEAVLANVNAMQHMPLDVRPVTWARAMRRHNWSALLPASATRTPASWGTAIRKRFGIEYVGRFRSMDHLYTMLHNRAHPGRTREKPVAVLLMAKADWNDALAKFPLHDRLAELGYAVSYYEVGYDTEIEPILSEATRGGRRPVSLLAIAGHGFSSEAAIDLGGRYRTGYFIGSVMPTDGSPISPQAHEEEYLDWRDLTPATQIPFAKYLAPQGDVLLLSCSAARLTDFNADNMANLLAAQLPAGVTVHASSQSSNMRAIDRRPDGTLRIRWEMRHSGYTVGGGRRE